MQHKFDQFLHYTYEAAIDNLTALAESNGYTINVIPDGVGNIDIEDNRVNVWVEQSTGVIYRITIG